MQYDVRYNMFRICLEIKQNIIEATKRHMLDMYNKKRYNQRITYYLHQSSAMSIQKDE